MGTMRLRRVGRNQIAAMREARRRSLPLGLVPGFYARLVDEAVPHLLEESSAGDGSRSLGYALLLERAHEGHAHVTVLEVYLHPDHKHRFEEALDLLRDQVGPTTYLARTDDCLYDATLLSRGLQVEPTALVLLVESRNRLFEPESRDPGRLDVVPLVPRHMAGLRALLDDESKGHAPGAAGSSGADGAPHEHRHGPTTDELVAELEQMAADGRDWVLLADGEPVAVIARQDGADGVHELLDIALGMAPEADLAWGLSRAAQKIMREGLYPAAVIDALETARHRIFRAAGFYTAAAYLVFYDSEVGRPSVGRVTLEELRELYESGEAFRLVDVMGEEHWRAGHLPGAEWIDFKGLAREARRRFQPEEPIILYCNGFT